MSRRPAPGGRGIAPRSRVCARVASAQGRGTGVSYLQSYDGKKVLVTGGGGSIGTNLVRALVKAGARLVIILDDFSAAYEWNIPSLPGVMVVRGSVDDDISLKRVFNESRSRLPPARLLREPE